MEAKKHVYSPLEKKVLIESVKKYEHIVENKKTDGSTVRSKNTAWEHITREYNASPLITTRASTKQLRRLWLNTKQRQRDVLTKERQQRLGTGGGPPTTDAVIDPDLSFLTPGLLVSVPGAIDSDTASEMIESFNTQLPNELEDFNSPDPPTITVIYSPNESPNRPSQAAPISPQQNENATLPHCNTAPLPTTSKTYQNQKKTLIEKEYQDRKARAKEIHEMELKILNERLREAKANADLAEYVLELRKSAPHLSVNGRCNDDQRFQN